MTGGLEEGGHWQLPGKQEREVFRSGLRIQQEREASNTSLQLHFVEGKGLIYQSMGPIEMNRFYQGTASLLHENSWLRARVWCDYHRIDNTFVLPLYYNGIKLGEMPDRLLMDGFTVDGDVQSSWSPFANNTLLGGINYRWLVVSINVNNPNETYQHRLGFFVQDEQRLWDRLLISAAVRLDYNSITPLAISPRLAIGWSFHSRQLLRFAFGQAFRKPSLMQSSMHMRGVEGTSSFPELEAFFERSIGNEYLSNDSITAFEIGYRGQFLDRRLTLEADVFYNLYRDGIGFNYDMKINSMGLPDLSKSVLRFENTLNIDSFGGSLSASYQLPEVLLLSINYTFRHSADLVADTDPIVVARMGNNRDTYWEPKHLFNASCQVWLLKGLRMGLALQSKSSSVDFVTEDGGVFAQRVWVNLPTIVYLNANLAWRVSFGQRWLELSMNAFNLFNQGFRDAVGHLRYNGEVFGGELVGRTMMLLLRAEL